MKAPSQFCWIRKKCSDARSEDTSGASRRCGANRGVVGTTRVPGASAGDGRAPEESDEGSRRGVLCCRRCGRNCRVGACECDGFAGSCAARGDQRAGGGGKDAQPGDGEIFAGGGRELGARAEMQDRLRALERAAGKSARLLRKKW